MPTVPAAARTAQRGLPDSAANTEVELADRTWQLELSQALRSVPALLEFVGLSHDSADSVGCLPADATALFSPSVLEQFPVLVPRSFANRMRRGDANDPLLKQVLPCADEAAVSDGFVSDAVGDANARRVPGLLQKYDGRVLFIAAGACAVHCRYCFRREYPYADEPRRLDDWQPAFDAIASDSSVHEIIFSGGDPLMLSDDRLLALCERVDQIPHVDRIRFHTRLPIVLPSRVTAGLLARLTKLRAQPIMVVHANHANEVVTDCADALRMLVRSGIPVLNQAVLLRGINDSVEALAALCTSLVNLGVMPYYLHQLDRVTGTAHFEVPRERGLELIAQLATRLPGYAIPKYVEEIPGEPSKSGVAKAESGKPNHQ